MVKPTVLKGGLQKTKKTLHIVNFVLDIAEVLLLNFQNKFEFLNK